MSFIAKKLHGIINRPSKRKTVSDHVSFENAKSIGLLFTWEDQRTFDELEQFISEVRLLKEVNVLCYNPTKEPLSIHYPKFDLSELTGFGKLNSEAANTFVSTPFDFLFHLDFELNEITQSILSRSKAKCRMGINSEAGKNYYELMIGLNKSAGLTNFASQVLKYAKGIK